MTQTNSVTILPSFLKWLRMLVVGSLGMVGGIVCISIGLTGLGNGTVVACAVAVGLTTVLFMIGVLTQRPRIVLAPEGFVFDKLFGREAHQWEEIDGPFVVIKIGWSNAVAYRLTADYKASAGRKPTSLYAGYDAVIMVGALRPSPEELAQLLNEHKRLRPNLSVNLPEPDAPATHSAPPDVLAPDGFGGRRSII